MGFTHNEILYELTSQQVSHYYELIQKTQQDSLKQQCVATQVAFHADEKQFNDYIKGDL